MTNNREKTQRAQQRALKEMEIEEAREQRLRDDRIKAYIDLAGLMYTFQSTNAVGILEVLRAYSAIAVLGGSPETREAVETLYNRVVDLRNVASTVD